MKRVFTLILLISSILATAQEDDINITVRKASEISLSPDIFIIFSDVNYTFALRGMKKGITAQATLTQDDYVKVEDTILTLNVHRKSTEGDGYDTARALLHLRVVDRNGKEVSTFERNFGVMVRQYPKSVPDTTSRRFGMYVSHFGYDYEFIYKGISHSTDKELRKYTGMKFTYVDSTTKDNFVAYRAMELRINGKNGEMKYNAPSSFITVDMRRALLQQRGKSKYTFILHKRYPRGDRSKKDITDTVSYDPAIPDKTGDRRKY